MNNTTQFEINIVLLQSNFNEFLEITSTIHFFFQIVIASLGTCISNSVYKISEKTRFPALPEINTGSILCQEINCSLMKKMRKKFKSLHVHIYKFEKKMTYFDKFPFKDNYNTGLNKDTKFL